MFYIISQETHIFHEFPEDFYEEHLKVIIVGYLRPMCGFDSLGKYILLVATWHAYGRKGTLQGPLKIQNFENAVVLVPRIL